MTASRPWVEVVLAMSADGKIADGQRSPQRIASPRDRTLLDERLLAADATLYGAGTLRAVGKSIQVSPGGPSAGRVTNIVASTRAEFDLDLPFFAEPGPRWLVCSTPPTPPVARCFDEILVCRNGTGDGVDWPVAMERLAGLGIGRICCGGGGELAAALARHRLIDEYRITVAPLLIGGRSAPTPVDGEDLGLGRLPELRLVRCDVVDGEVFLRYQVVRADSTS